MTIPDVDRPRFGVWAPVYGNHGARNHPADAPDAGYRRNRDLLVRAERSGYDSTLLAQHVIHPSNVEDDVLETWSTLAALAEATSRIELIGAIKPLLLNPLVFAKIAGNIAAISDGRLALNVVSGWFLPELEALGVAATDHDDRYAYTREWLETLLDLWAGKQVDIGSRGGQPAIVRPIPADPPPVYFGGESEPARAWQHATPTCSSSTAAPWRTPSTSSRTCAPGPAIEIPCGSPCLPLSSRATPKPRRHAELDRLQALVDAEKRPESRRVPIRTRRCTSPVRTPSRVGSNGGTLAGLVGSY